MSNQSITFLAIGDVHGQWRGKSFVETSIRYLFSLVTFKRVCRIDKKVLVMKTRGQKGSICGLVQRSASCPTVLWLLPVSRLVR